MVLLYRSFIESILTFSLGWYGNLNVQNKKDWAILRWPARSSASSSPPCQTSSLARSEGRQDRFQGAQTILSLRHSIFSLQVTGTEFSGQSAIDFNFPLSLVQYSFLMCSKGNFTLHLCTFCSHLALQHFISSNPIQNPSFIDFIVVVVIVYLCSVASCISPSGTIKH